MSSPNKIKTTLDDVIRAYAATYGRDPRPEVVAAFFRVHVEDAREAMERIRCTY